MTIALGLLLFVTQARADASLPKSLVGSWAIDPWAANKVADELDRAGEEEAASLVSLLAAGKLTLTFKADGSLSSELGNRFGQPGPKTSYSAKYVVSSNTQKGMTLSVTDEQATRSYTVRIFGEALRVTDDDGLTLSFVRMNLLGRVVADGKNSL